MHKCFNNAHLSGDFLFPRSPMMRSGFALCRVVTEWTGLVWTVLQYALQQLVVISCVGTGLSNGRSPILDDQINVKVPTVTELILNQKQSAGRIRESRKRITFRCFVNLDIQSDFDFRTNKDKI